MCVEIFWLRPLPSVVLHALTSLSVCRSSQGTAHTRPDPFIYSCSTVMIPMRFALVWPYTATSEFSHLIELQFAFYFFEMFFATKSVTIFWVSVADISFWRKIEKLNWIFRVSGISELIFSNLSQFRFRMKRKAYLIRLTDVVIANNDWTVVWTIDDQNRQLGRNVISFFFFWLQYRVYLVWPAVLLTPWNAAGQ